MINIIWVAAGGALGASLRYSAYIFCKNYLPNYPISTLFVNIVGSFLIGVLMNYINYKIVSENFIRYFLIIGLLGSFTTFSTFSYEVIDLLNNKKILISFSYVIISFFGCLLFAYLGFNFNKI